MKYIYIFILCFLFVTPVNAQDLTDSIQVKYQNLKSITADFSQKLQNGATKEIEMRDGKFDFQKPLLLRWETNAPNKELMIASKSFFWDYFPDEEIVYKYKISDVFKSKIMLGLISGKASLKKDFKILKQFKDNDLVCFELRPKQDEAEVSKAEVWVNSETFMITRMRLTDFFGNKNDVSFKNIVINGEIKDSQFIFNIPKDVMVEDNTRNK